MRYAIAITALFVCLLLAGCGTPPQEQEQPTNGEPKQIGEGKDLKQILEAKIKYTADYDVVASGQTETMKMTYVMDLPKFAMIAKMPQGETRSIFKENEFIVCTSTQGTWQCFTTPVDEPETMTTEDAITQGDVTPVYKGTCTKAGETGMEYEISAQGTTSTICYTSDGILLAMSSQGVSMTATKVSRSVDSSVFTPPAAPQDLSAMLPEGYQIPTQ